MTHEQYGYIGELKTAFSILNSGAVGYGRCLANIYLPLYDSTTEIDFLVVHTTGIYFIESKNYKGKVMGSKDSKMWTHIYKDKTTQFYSPLLQNQTHIKTLAYHTKLDKSKMYSYIVFDDDTILNGVQNNKQVTIINRSKLISKFRQDAMSRPQVFTPEQVNYIIKMLEPYTKVSEAVKQKHIADIKSRRNRK